MTFDDLPPGWDQLPLTNPALARDVVDLCVGLSDRAAYSLAILICDSDARLLQPLVIGEVDFDMDEASPTTPLHSLAAAIPENSSLLFVLSRPQGDASALDLAWAASLREATTSLGWTYLGCYLALVEPETVVALEPLKQPTLSPSL